MVEVTPRSSVLRPRVAPDRSSLCLLVRVGQTLSQSTSDLSDELRRAEEGKKRIRERKRQSGGGRSGELERERA